MPATDDRAELLAAVDLEALFEQRVGPRHRGGWPCPNKDHAQTGASPPVAIDAAKGLWHCHGCAAGGTAVDVLVMTGMSTSEAFAELRRLAGKPAPRQRTPEPRRSHAAPPERPVAPEEAERVLDRFLEQRGWRRDVAERAGLHVVASRWSAPRVRFPYRFEGEVTWFQDRATDPNARAKYLSPPGKRPEAYNVDDLADAIRVAHDIGSAVVLEGAADAIAVAHAWPSGAVIALPGTTSPVAKRLVRALAGLHVVTVLDPDPAGDRCAAELGRQFAAAGCRVWHLRPPSDLDDWRRATGCDDTVFASELDSALDDLKWEAGHGR